MIKKGIKIITLLLICFLVMSILGIGNLKVYAEEENNIVPLDPTENLNFWEPLISTSVTFKNKINVIITILKNIGMLVSVITLAIIGIKYMLGSVEEKAQYKQTLMPWIIGAILVFAITLLPTIIFNLTKGILTEEENKTYINNPGGGTTQEPY